MHPARLCVFRRRHTQPVDTVSGVCARRSKISHTRVKCVILHGVRHGSAIRTLFLNERTHLSNKFIIIINAV